MFTEAHTPRLTPEGAFTFPFSSVSGLRRRLQRGLDTGSARAGRVPRGVARRGDAGRRGPTCLTCLRGGPGAAGHTAALSEAGRADGGGHVCGAQHRGGPQGPHPRCVFRLPRAPDGHLLQRSERQGARGTPGCPGPGTEGREAAQRGLAPTWARATAVADAATPEAARALPAGGLWGHSGPRSRRIPSALARGGSRPRGAKRTRMLGMWSGPRLWFYALVLTLGFPWGCLFPMALCVSFLWASPVFLCPGHMDSLKG